jgi:hypothetical protein
LAGLPTWLLQEAAHRARQAREGTAAGRASAQAPPLAMVATTAAATAPAAAPGAPGAEVLPHDPPKLLESQGQPDDALAAALLRQAWHASRDENGALEASTETALFNALVAAQRAAKRTAPSV